MKDGPSSSAKSAWRPNVRLCVLLLLTSTTASCSTLFPEPVVVTKIVEQQCPRPVRVQLDPPRPSGYYRDLILRAITDDLRELAQPSTRSSD